MSLTLSVLFIVSLDCLVSVHADLSSIPHSDTGQDVMIPRESASGESKAMDEVIVTANDMDVLDKRTLIKLHGAFMVVAWMGTTTIGVLIAR